MQIEFNEKFKAANDTFSKGNVSLMITPPLSEDYWVFRVKLFKDQSLLAFPKFSTIGIGFAQEEDWNTNLPYTCTSTEICEHIYHNKQYDEITKDQVMQAIELLQPFCKRFLVKS